MKRALTWLGVAMFVVASLAAVELVSHRGRRWDAGLVPAAQARGRTIGDVVNHGCSNNTLNGSFGFTFSGAAVISGFEGKPGVVVGLMTFDGHGHLTAVVTANANGTVLRRETQGTYTVNPDCTGSITAVAVPVSLLTFQADGVVVRDGTEMLFVGTIPELVFSGVAKKL
jgi:hypothetical protein